MLCASLRGCVRFHFLLCLTVRHNSCSPRSLFVSYLFPNQPVWHIAPRLLFKVGDPPPPTVGGGVGDPRGFPRPVFGVNFFLTPIFGIPRDPPPPGGDTPPGWVPAGSPPGLKKKPACTPYLAPSLQVGVRHHYSRPHRRPGPRVRQQHPPPAGGLRRPGPWPSRKWSGCDWVCTPPCIPVSFIFSSSSR